MPQPFSISNLPPYANFSASVLADEHGNRDEAVSRLRDIDTLMLGHYPSTLGCCSIMPPSRIGSLKTPIRMPTIFRRRSIITGPSAITF